MASGYLARGLHIKQQARNVAFRENADLLRQAFPERFSELQAAVAQFDGERALEVLNAAMADKSMGAQHG